VGIRIPKGWWFGDGDSDGAVLAVHHCFPSTPA